MPVAWLRLLPWVSAILGWVFAEQQWTDSKSYPWPLVTSFAVVLMIALWMVWKRMRLFEVITNFLPTCLALLAIGGSFLIVEDPVARRILSFAFAVIPFITLELFFVALFEPSRYPVNALSRWNLVLAPLIACCFAMSLNGLFVFMRWSPLIAPLVFTLLGAMVFGLTSHPEASNPHRQRWLFLGALVGLHVGVLIILLPLATAVHGAIAALVFSVPLRMRRYAHAPVPPQSLAISESVMAALCFGVLLFVSRWA